MTMRYDAIVVGAGPSGCCAAESLAREGFHVLVLEEHNRVGEPVQCAGLVSPRTLQLAGVTGRVVINSLTGARVFSSLGARLEVNGRKVQALAVDRSAFDRELAGRAKEAGAEICNGARVGGLRRISGGYLVMAQKNGASCAFEARLLVGADGANSRVARWLGLKNNNPRAVMYAADVELRRDLTGLVDIFLGRGLAPGWFGWVIPMDDKTCRVGTGYAFSRISRSPRYYFQQIVKQFPNQFKGMKIIRYTGGTAPMGLMPKIHTPHAMLVGDAACQTKPISGGGIYLGIRGARMCARVAAAALREDNLTEKRLAQYQQMWEEEYAEEITCGISHRESFLNFTDEDIDQLLRFLNRPYWQSMVLKHGDIDYPSWLARRLFSAGPWMQRFVKVALGLAGYGSQVKNGLKNMFS